MKIRIKGNSIRLRLSKTDIAELTDEGFVMETTNFLGSVLSYSVEQNSEIDQLSASFDGRKITLQIPSGFVEDWAINDIVGFEANINTTTNNKLHLLIEKDFKCLDQTTDDQSNQYENPKKTC